MKTLATCSLIVLLLVFGSGCPFPNDSDVPTSTFDITGLCSIEPSEPGTPRTDYYPRGVLDFGAVPVGDHEDLVFTVTYADLTEVPQDGSLPAHVYSIHIEQCDHLDGDFHFELVSMPEHCGPPPPGYTAWCHFGDTGNGTFSGSDAFTARFAPLSTGAKACEIRVDAMGSSGEVEPCAVGDWTGTGVESSLIVDWYLCHDGLASGIDADLHGVIAIMDPYRIFAVGDGGTVLMSVGDCNWERLETGFDHVDFTGVWGTSPDDLWVVGNAGSAPQDTGIILRYDGRRWSLEDSDFLITYNALWGSSANDVYFLGVGVATDYYNAKHYDGTALDTLTIDDGWSEITGVSGISSDDVWVVMNRPSRNIWHYDGSTWEDRSEAWMDQPLHDVWVAPTGEVFAVGANGATYHYDGSAWEDQTQGWDKHGVWGASASDVFAVGEIISHYNGVSWVLSGSLSLFAVGGTSGDDVYAVGEYGAIYRYAPHRPGS